MTGSVIVYLNAIRHENYDAVKPNIMHIKPPLFRYPVVVGNTMVTQPGAKAMLSHFARCGCNQFIFHLVLDNLYSQTTAHVKLSQMLKS